MKRVINYIERNLKQRKISFATYKLHRKLRFPLNHHWNTALHFCESHSFVRRSREWVADGRGVMKTTNGFGKFISATESVALTLTMGNFPEWARSDYGFITNVFILKILAGNTRHFYLPSQIRITSNYLCNVCLILCSSLKIKRVGLFWYCICQSPRFDFARVTEVITDIKIENEDNQAPYFKNKEIQVHKL